MSQHLIGAIGVAIAFAAIDLLWLGVIAKPFYSAQLGDLRADQFNIPAAIGFYVMIVAGVTIFALKPAFAEGSLMTAATYGALFGFFAYATYDLTNLATLRNWPVALTFVDMVWGTFLTSAAASSGYLLASKLA